MSQYDNTVVLTKRKTAAQNRGEKNVSAARRSGATVETASKFNAGSNKAGGGMDAAKLDRETDELKHKRVEKNVGKLIAKGRVAKGWSTKDLSTRINEKPQVISDYEQGRAIPNNQILGKIERNIGIKLRGKDIGNPLGGAKK